jgi:hypothetical protein
MRRLCVGLLTIGSAVFAAWTIPSKQSPSGESANSAIDWTHSVTVASGEGYQGPWRMNDSDFRYVDAPTVAVGEEGSVAVAWVDQAEKEVFLQRFTPDGEPTRSAPVRVSRSPHIFSWLPRIALGPAGSEEIHVLWQEIVFSGGSHGGEIFYARSTDDGRTFSAPLNLSNTPAGAGKGRLDPHLWHNGSLDLALGPDGTLYAAWTEYEGALRVSRSTDGGETFADPVAVDTGGGPARGPSLAVEPGGSVHLAWTVGDDRSADIRVARSSDGGRSFGQPRRVAPGSGHADAPKLAVEPGGPLHLVYAERAEGPSGPSRIRYTRMTRETGDFEEPRTLEAPAAAGGAGFPSIALDGGGNPILLWDLFPEPDGRPMALAIAVSSDGGEHFSSPAIVPGTGDPELGFQGSLQGLLMQKLAVGEAGEVAVVNGTFNPGERSRITLVLGRIRG